MSTICDMVVPRTMLSSTSSTLLPEKTAGMAFSLRRTDNSLVRWSGMMKVRPTYLFLTRPSRYGRPSSADIWMAAGREPSGTGTTQSMSQPDFLKAWQMTHELDPRVAHAETMCGKCDPQRKLGCGSPHVIAQSKECSLSGKAEGAMLCL